MRIDIDMECKRGTETRTEKSGGKRESIFAPTLVRKMESFRNVRKRSVSNPEESEGRRRRWCGGRG
jgi:hypothetical protein